METIFAKDIKARFVAKLPTCYVDVRPADAAMTFAIVQPFGAPTEDICGGLRCSIHELKNGKLERLEAWADQHSDHLVIIGCTTPHQYSEGVAQMLPILRGANINTLAIHGTHYDLHNAILDKLPKMKI